MRLRATERSARDSELNWEATRDVLRNAKRQMARGWTGETTQKIGERRAPGGKIFTLDAAHGKGQRRVAVCGGRGEIDGSRFEKLSQVRVQFQRSPLDPVNAFQDGQRSREF